MTIQIKKQSMAYKVLKSVALNAPMKRIELSKILEIKKPNITTTLAPLMADGLIIEETPGNIRSGLIMSNKHFVLSFELTETSLNYTKVFLNGECSEITSVTLSSIKVSDVCSQIKAILDTLDSNSKYFAGASIVVPGQIDRKSGIVLYSARIQWESVPLAEMLYDLTKIMFSIDNNTRCQLRKIDWYDNYLTRSSSTIFISIDEGVGCSLSISGQILEGSNLAAGEIGHLVAGNENRVCRCGKLDCLQTYCNLPQLLADTEQVLSGNIISIDEAYSISSNKLTIDNILNRVAKKLSSVLIPSISLLDPQTILVSCSDPTVAKLISKHMTKYLEEQHVGSRASQPMITPISADTRYGLMGAASLSFESLFLKRV